MADHIPLPPPRPLSNGKRRRGYSSEERPFDAPQHARSLRGILEGLEADSPGLFGTAKEEPGLDAADLGRVVLKFTGRAPFALSGLGAWEHRLHSLGFTHDRAFYALSDADSRAFLRELTDGYAAAPDSFSPKKPAWLTALKNIENVELYGRADRAAPDLTYPVGDQTTVVDVNLWPTSVATRGAEREAKARLAELEGIVTAATATNARVRVLVADASNTDRILLRARVDGATLDAILDHPLVERVDGPLRVDVRAEDLTEAARPTVGIVPEGAPIGIIDDLVSDANPWMASVVVERRNFPSDAAFGTATTHGSHVAAIAAWGSIVDLLGGTVDRSPHPIYSARVAHANASGEAEFIAEPAQQIADAMRWLANKGVRIVVLAFARTYADSNALPDDLSATIDGLAADLGLVVIVSAGNLTELPHGSHWKNDYPAYLNDSSAKVSAPGTAAIPLTVGSRAHSGEVDRERFPRGERITTLNQPAPYSRTGPTATGRQKPEVTHYGGSWAWDHEADSLILRDPNVATLSLSPVSGGRLFSVVAGTSYAAPRVAHEVAEIATRYPAAGANLLRALTVLSAQQPTGMQVPQHGAYGVPQAHKVLESGGSRAILVYEGTITGQSYEVIELPVPPEFASGGAWDREIRIAVAFDPVVRRSRREYTNGHVKVDFVRNISMREIDQIYRTQPTLAERQTRKLPTIELPTGHERPPLRPGVNAITGDTVHCRSFRTSSASWNEDDEGYYLIVEHTYSPWTDGQKDEFPTQNYAIAVELSAHGKPELDLHALTQARLAARNRPRARR